MMAGENLKKITTTQCIEARSGSLKLVSDLDKVNSADPGVAAARQQGNEALASVLLAQVRGLETKASTGWSVYFPNQKRYDDSGYGESIPAAKSP